MMKKKRKLVAPIPAKEGDSEVPNQNVLADHSRSPTIKGNTPPPPEKVYIYENLWSRFYIVVIVALIIGVIWAAYSVYLVIRRYLLSKDIEVVINLVHPTKPTVGETLSCRIRFRKKGGKIIPFNSKTFHELEENITVEPINEMLQRPIAVLQEFNNKNSHITGKFSLRKSGTYEIKVKYHRFYLTTETPLALEVLPGSVSPKYMDFETHNPYILCLTAGFQQYFKILARDEYGNKCRVEDVEIGKLGFQLFLMGNQWPVEYEFCYHNFATNVSNGISGTTGDSCSLNVCLKVKVTQPGVYHCFLKYEDYIVCGTHWSPKLLVCISSEEETDLRAMFSKVNIPGSLIYSSECKLSFLGDEDGFQDYFVGISAHSLVFALYSIPLRLYPDARFPINGRTKIIHSSSQILTANDTDSLNFMVQDGLRRSVRLQMSSSPARMFLVTFAHNQGFLLPKSKMSFQEKKEILKDQLSGYFTWFNTEKILRIEPANLTRSSLKEVPLHPDDWLLPFKIIYEGSPSPSIVGVQVWINRLCEEYFNRNGETGMFQRLQGSKLLHPISSTVSHQPLENYRLAGQILAKAIVETLLRGICTQLSQVRFTRSLLSFILGYPINFKFLEADEPIFFRQLMPIVEADLNGDEYYFTTYPSTTSDTNIVNLIPNGSNIPVTNTNKEHYLDLLANYRLIHAVEQEITAFRDGFYDVINKDYLSNFQEYDLQKLISGGCKFSIADLKEHHRVVKEVDNGYMSAIRKTSVDTNKLLDWFWVAADNLSEEEQSYLIFFATGSFSLPSCGLADLNPLFTISLTGTFNQPPKAHPVSNEIVLGDHACFENFERSLLYAIKPESERIMLPTTDMICFQDGLCGGDSNVDALDEMEEEEERTETSESQHIRARGVSPSSDRDPFLNWLQELINI